MTGLPDQHGRLQILNIHTETMRTHKKLAPDVDLTELAAQTKNFSGAEIEGLVRAAQSTAMNRLIKVRKLEELRKTLACVCVCVRVHACVHACMRAYVHVCVCACMHVGGWVGMHAIFHHKLQCSIIYLFRLLLRLCNMFVSGALSQYFIWSLTFPQFNFLPS